MPVHPLSIIIQCLLLIQQHVYIHKQQHQQIMNNRNPKPTSLTKRKLQSLQFSSSLLKCNGLMSVFSMKNNRMDPQYISSNNNNNTIANTNNTSYIVQLNNNINLVNNNIYNTNSSNSISHNRKYMEQRWNLSASCGQKHHKLQQKQDSLQNTRQKQQKVQQNQLIQNNNTNNNESKSSKQKSNIYRSRKDKRSSLSKNKILKAKLTQNNKLIVFFRNQLVSLFSILGRREEFISSLRGNRLSFINHPLKNVQIQQKLLKQLNGKGKDKQRKNFNHLTNQQLRSLKYKPKPVPMTKKQSTKDKTQKNKNDSDEQVEDDKNMGNEQQQDYPDIATWKRKNGVNQNQKVFIVKGGYHTLRETLLSKGWAQNQQVHSKFFDLKWTTKIFDIDYSALKTGQFVNHFNNNHHLTSKYGITRRLRSLPINYNVDIDRFYPRCYDLGDQYQFQNFVQSFKFCFAQSVAKRFIKDKQRYKKLQLKIWIVLKILRRYSLSFSQKINKINAGQFPVISAQEWQIITETDQLPQQLKQQKLAQLRQQQPIIQPIIQNKITTIEHPVIQDNQQQFEYDDDNQQLSPSSQKHEKQPQQQFSQQSQQYFKHLHNLISQQLQKIQRNDPQYQLDGYRNVWIAKPNCTYLCNIVLSRGRGIRCFNNLYEIADYCLGRDVQFVIQKYIQRPLLIQGKKFDIRQWVLIQDYCPPKIYFYNQCYLRFSMDDFSLDNIHNRFIHLTNNSVQKHNKSKKSKIDQSMWEMSQFAKHIGQQKWLQVQNKIKNIVVWSIKSCENYVTAKRGSIQLVGFDFMIDQKFNPWLIQINMSPSMDSSTPVTKKLVKMLLHDTGLLIANSTKNKKNIGNFTCIYEDQRDLVNFTEYICKQ